MNGQAQKITVDFNGKKYLWNGREWIDLKNFMAPPLAIMEKLNEKIKNIEINYNDMALSDLITLASNFKDSGNFGKAMEIIEYILNRNPGESATLSILCSILRKKGKPDEALKRTNNYNYANAALLISRAAVMCDLGMWEDAKKEVGRALAINKNNKEGNYEAFNVVKRIKENRLDLY